MSEEISREEIAALLARESMSGDAISRQAVLESIFDDDTEYTGSEICSMVRNLPPVTPQPKTGHWISSLNDCFAHCSECGLHGDKGIYKHYKYCPNCGAQMESEEQA